MEAFFGSSNRGNGITANEPTCFAEGVGQVELVLAALNYLDEVSRTEVQLVEAAQEDEPFLQTLVEDLDVHLLTRVEVVTGERPVS